MNEQLIEQSIFRIHQYCCGCLREDCEVEEEIERLVYELESQLRPQHDHPASSVVLELSHRLLKAARADDQEEAQRYSDLAVKVEDEFPEAKEELGRLYKG